MLNELFHEILNHEGVVSIVSWANGDAHVVNTWNSYLNVKDNDKLLIPAFGMRKTEENVNANENVKLTLGSKEVQGKMAMGTGVLVEGTAKFITSGADVDMMKEKFTWANRVLEVTVTSVKQTI